METKVLKPGHVGLIVAVLLAVQCLFIAVVVGLARSSRQAHERMILNRDQTDVWLPSTDPAIIRPHTARANEAKLRPDRPAVGVEVGGKARAYSLDALGDQSGHVVNDMIGDTPVSVAFCGITQCLRIYTDSVSSVPLDVEVAGLFNREMVLKIAGTLYLLDSGRPLKPESNLPTIPYRALTPTVTTWESWLKTHPNTDLYVGNSR